MYNIQRGPDRGPHEHQDPEQKQEAMDASKPSQSTTSRYVNNMESESAEPQYLSYSHHSRWQRQDLPESYPQPSYSGAGQQLPSAARPWECKVIGCAADVQTWVAESGLKRHQKIWHGPHACEIMDCPRSAPNGFGSATELQQHTSNKHYLNQGPISNLVDAVANTSLQPGNKIDNESGQARIITRNPEDNSQTEIFNPCYKLHTARDFKFGRVFKILWTEPRGAGGTSMSERVGKWGQVFNEKVRRFVIIDCRKGHCICLPIMTYGGQGCLKKGVHAEDHAIIYTSSQPTEFAGEGMRKKPIKVKPYSPQHKLEAASRLNYAKVYTIEYNVKVWFIGEIQKDSEWWFTTDYNETHPLLTPRGNPPMSDGGSSYQHQDVGAGSSGAQMSSWAGDLQYASAPHTGISKLDPYASSYNAFSYIYPISTTGTTQAPDYSPAEPDGFLTSYYSPSWQTYHGSTQIGSYSRRDDSNPGEYQTLRSTLTPRNLDALPASSGQVMQKIT